MKRRLVYVAACPYPVPQGSQVFLRDSATLMQGLGHDVCLVVYDYGSTEPPPDLPVFRCSSLPFGKRTAAGPSWSKPLRGLALVRTLRRVVGERRADAVIAHNYEGLLVALAARLRPVIYQAHNAMAEELPFYARGRLIQALSRRFGSFLDRALPKRADAVIAPHAALAEYLIAAGCPQAKVARIPPPMDAAAWTPGQPAAGPPAILYTGNLDAYQNLGFLRRVMERVRRAEPDARLTVATSRPEAVAGVFGGEAHAVDTPDFAATQRVLAQDAVVVCPRVSWSGYPIKLLNAMAAGKPVVACRGAAHPLTDGADGLVVDDNGVNAFAEAVLRLWHDPGLRARLGTAARETVAEHHAPTKVAAQVETVLERAIARTCP